jgi:hypothetical protein
MMRFIDSEILQNVLKAGLIGKRVQVYLHFSSLLEGSTPDYRTDSDIALNIFAFA